MFLEHLLLRGKSRLAYSFVSELGSGKDTQFFYFLYRLTLFLSVMNVDQCLPLDVFLGWRAAHLRGKTLLKMH